MSKFGVHAISLVWPTKYRVPPQRVDGVQSIQCQAVLDSEQELNTLDAATADGDLGRNMARAAQCPGGAGWGVAVLGMV